MAFYALYGRGLAGGWRAAYVVTANLALYFNVFVLVVQTFEGAAPGGQRARQSASGPLFGAVQGMVLLAFLYMGWRAVKLQAIDLIENNLHTFCFNVLYTYRKRYHDTWAQILPLWRACPNF